MSITFPKRLEDVPSHGHFNSENGVVRGVSLFRMFHILNDIHRSGTARISLSDTNITSTATSSPCGRLG